MTLILSFVQPRFAIQVSDRLVTVIQPNAPARTHDPLANKTARTHDPLANKTVIYITKNAFVSISYSGRAYMGGLPTDKWIAGVLWGESLKDAPEKAATLFSRPKVVRDIGLASMILAEAMSTELSILPRGQRTAQFVSVTGWHFGKERDGPRLMRPFIFEIDNLSDDERIAFQIHRRVPREVEPSQFFGGSNPHMLTSTERNDLRLQLARCRRADEVEETLVGAVRRVATRSPIVGPNSLSVLIEPPRARVRYFPEEREAQIVGEGDLADLVPAGHRSMGTEIPIAYTPYVVGTPRAGADGGVFFPSIFSGSFRFEIDPLVVEFEGPKDAGQTVWPILAQPRPPEPT